MQVSYYLLVVLLGYLCGAFPTGYVSAKLWSGVDIRRIGSGKTGGTNVLRSAGVVPAAITVIVDTLKGTAAVLLAQWLIGTPLAAALAGAAAVLGHNHSIFLNFKGGAGSMVNVGALFALAPWVSIAAALASIVPLVVLRFASLGSITLAVLTMLLLCVGALPGWLPPEYILYGLLSTALTLYALRHNIERLRKGTERKIGDRTQAAPTGGPSS